MNIIQLKYRILQPYKMSKYCQFLFTTDPLLLMNWKTLGEFYILNVLSGFDIMAATLFRLGWRILNAVHTKYFNYSDNYIIFHTSGQQLSVMSLHCSYVVWCFKCFCSLKPDGFWLASGWKIVQKIDSNDIVSLCRYCYSDIVMWTCLFSRNKND